MVSRRYERKSLVLTTNLAFSDWPTIFPNAACTTALIDRVVHHAEIQRGMQRGSTFHAEAVVEE